MADRACSVKGCIRPYRARGFCATHWARWRKTGDPGANENLPRCATEVRLCEVPGCENPHLSRGWCAKHYMRWYTTGTVGLCRLTSEERFWQCVDFSGDCWEWTKHLVTGYGRFWIGSAKSGRAYQAHRYAYELLVGPIPSGTHLDHLCRNRACVNPDHLEPVAPRINYLRGNGAAARNARKETCKRGHPLSGDNLMLSSDGKRGCRTCHNEQSRISQQRRRTMKTS